VNSISDSRKDGGNEWQLTRWLFLRLLGIVHLSGFSSYASQIISLNGSHGVLPTGALLGQVSATIGIERFFFFPTLAWLSSSDSALMAVAIAGSVLSLLIVGGVITGPALIANAILWLSIITGGGEFSEFQSDGMLIETTILALFVVPWCRFEAPWPVRMRGKRNTAAPSKPAIWLLRFFIFRFMLASGIVKILSGDPTWANLTALQFHFETQPLPTPLAWYMNQLPAVVLKGMVVMMFITELIGPFLIFGPRVARLVAFALFSGLQVMIESTGNYTFLNLLTFVMAIPVLDDKIVGRVFPKSLVEKIEPVEKVETPQPAKIRKYLFNFSVAVFFLLAGSQLTLSVLGFAVPPMGAILYAIEPLHLVDRYGLFAVMTTDRPEIVFEGSNDGKTWQSYVFSYKVDDIHEAPPWVAPHMPRLPWRLWFAAMSPISENRWVLNLAQRVLQGSVYGFFEKNPFENHPPRYLRARLYHYHFTDFKQKAQSGDWWWRDNGREYFPPLELKDGMIEIAPLGQS